MKANLCILCYCKIGGNSLQIFTTQVFERPTWDDMLITVCQSFTEFFFTFSADITPEDLFNMFFGGMAGSMSYN
jgi:hypothetical protein